MEYHKLLNRQMTRLGLSEALPTPEGWASFKEIISKTYTENDQERYLQERSMEISSQEMYEINEKLQRAQETANLGYWIYNKQDNMITLSQTLYRIFGLDPTDPAPTFDHFMQKIHKDNRDHLNRLIENAFDYCERYEYEFQMQHTDGEYRWYQTIGYPVSNQCPTSTLTGITMDITKRKKTEEEINNLHKQLIDSARNAGMADIASSTLHNVGNILNSAKVSIEILKEQAALTSKDEIENITSLLRKNLSRLSEYIQTDPQGKYVPDYLIALLDNIKNNYTAIEKEIDNIRKHLSHINDIIAVQNEISRTPKGIAEKTSFSQILDASLNMVSVDFDRYNIRVIKDYKESNSFLIDKSKLTQILINLIKNAKEALIEGHQNIHKSITCSYSDEESKDNIIIKIQDNGAGIDKKDLKKIFNLGFTTKPYGHGIGLHMSAINAKELGGSLNVKSNGSGEGSTFILTLPKYEA